MKNILKFFASRPASQGKNVCWQHDPTHPHNSKKHETGKR